MAKWRRPRPKIADRPPVATVSVLFWLAMVLFLCTIFVGPIRSAGKSNDEGLGLLMASVTGFGSLFFLVSLVLGALGAANWQHLARRERIRVVVPLVAALAGPLVLELLGAL